MERSLHLLEQVGDAVEAETGTQRPEISRLDAERLARSTGTARGQPVSKGLVDDRTKGSASASRLGLQFGDQVVIEG